MMREVSPGADTGAALRALYAPHGGVRAVFSTKVADYLASRPDYPAVLFDRLSEIGALHGEAVVADLGAGTGLLTRDLLARGSTVYAVEPNPDMRRAADALLGQHGGYRSVQGSAEATTLPDASVDLITAAQAFHWFDIEPARAEAARILRPGAKVALIWNDRVPGDALHAALDEVFETFGGARRAALVAHEDRSKVSLYFGAACIETIELPHEHQLDQAGLEALVLSRSYMPARECDAGLEVRRLVARVFDRFAAGNGRVVVRYRTVALVGRPGDGPSTLAPAALLR